MLPLLTVPLVNSSELSTHELKKGAIVHFSSVVDTRQKVRPDLGRIQKRSNYMGQNSRLQETTKIKVVPFPGYYAYETSWCCPKSLSC